VMNELLPRVKALTVLARKYDIGLNIDAEEADRLEISLDILEALCQDPDLAGWDGIGFVIQAYQKRAPYVIDYVIDLGRRTQHRLMIRLVKGAYWDTEIKNTQVQGLDGYPVFTRKVYTDVSYLACAKKLLDAPDAVFPQFATHNAHTLAAIYHMAGPDFTEGQYEFQCLHGMGEPLYAEVVGPRNEGKLDRPCRIYAPVGTHKTLLAYLVRRLLENGANSSFVNRIADEDVSIDELIRDPIQETESIHPLGEPHPMIPLPRDLYRAQGEPRANSEGTDLSDEDTLRSLSTVLLESSQRDWVAQPTLVTQRVAIDSDGTDTPNERWHAVRNPANHQDTVGQAMFSDTTQLQASADRAAIAMKTWQHTTAQERAQLLLKAADLLEERQYLLIGLIVREAGKTYMNAINEIREAVDFLRYYAKRSVEYFDPEMHRPLGPVACISPWNFPLAIFLGQVSAALAAGNTVIAKPAEQTTLIGAQGVQLLHDAGFPGDVIQLLPGAGDIGAALVANTHIQAVMFTGSTQVAQSIARTVSERSGAHGQPIPLIAETGGLNALVVDSSALPEQVTGDVLDSAFDSAGQRCSALRILCIQEDVANTMLTMITGAMHELKVANPDLLATDVGPVIDSEAQDTIRTHIDKMRAAGFTVEQVQADAACDYGTYVPPTLIHINDISDVEKEIFGPVLHVLTYKSQELDTLLDKINAAGYGLTFGVHSRIDEHIDALTQHIHAGNIYVNRNIVGAIVGVQPFGGEGLSGTGPKAGGPLYLNRLLSQRAEPIHLDGQVETFAFNSVLANYLHWLEQSPLESAQQALPGVQQLQANSLFGKQTELPGPTGELNIYRLVGRGTVVCLPTTEHGLLIQIGTALATGNDLILCAHQGEALSAEALTRLVNALPESVQEQISFATDLSQALNGRMGGVLFEGAHNELNTLAQKLANHSGPILQPQGCTPQELLAGQYYRQELLLAERALSINTAAAGGNATLMAVI
ncbi:MAG TPA: bifunctional proline dehydrogenase/L-glutamate gamma-semialdehyde dehydrogenase PutA, partial [Paenalcaligenes sp.]|nr:bifunctional proline dehydrogenase/L-glutamate gamma-semialdehyde dehydrogenase PutA [Paenalcaligenes sp.]